MVHGAFPIHRFPPQWQTARFPNPAFQNPRPRFQPAARFPAFPPNHANHGFISAGPRFATTQVPVGVDVGWGQQERVQVPTATRPREIPLQVVCLVAAHLASTHAFATLANLNVTSRQIHDSTVPYVWRTVFWNWNGTSESRRGVLDDHGWSVEYYVAEKWNRKRWDQRLEFAKGARHIDFLLGPPLHRHFFVPWMNRKNWIPKSLVDTLKAAITYKIDSSTAESARTTNELEVYLCGKYKFGTDDVVELLDAIEPPLQDMDEDISSSGNDYHTRLVVLLDMTHDDPIRWYSQPTASQHTSRQQLDSRTYPWLRQVDLVICNADEFDLDRVAVAIVEGLTMLRPAVRAWWQGDDGTRPELVVKGIDAEYARRCAELFSQAIEENKEYRCITFKLLGIDLAHHLDLTAALYILHPIRSAYASLCIEQTSSARTIGSACIGGLSASDQGDDVGDGLERDVHAWVGMAESGRQQVDVTFTEGGTVHRESVVFEQAAQVPSWGDC